MLGEPRNFCFSYFPVIADNMCTVINFVIHADICECNLLLMFATNLCWVNEKNASAWENIGILTFLFPCKLCAENLSWLRLVGKLSLSGNMCVGYNFTFLFSLIWVHLC